MKTDHPKVQKKVAKKAAKKELEQSLTQKFLEAITHLGHDAEKIAGDIGKAAKSAANKLTKKFASDEAKAKKSIKPVKGVLVKKADDVKKVTIKGAKRAEKEVKKAVSNAKPITSSIKVVAIESVENAADVIKPKKAVSEQTVPVKAKVTKAPVKTSTAKTIIARKKPIEKKVVVDISKEDKADSDK